MFLATTLWIFSLMSIITSKISSCEGNWIQPLASCLQCALVEVVVWCKAQLVEAFDGQTSFWMVSYQLSSAWSPWMRRLWDVVPCISPLVGSDMLWGHWWSLNSASQPTHLPVDGKHWLFGALLQWVWKGWNSTHCRIHSLKVDKTIHLFIKLTRNKCVLD